MNAYALAAFVLIAAPDAAPDAITTHAFGIGAQSCGKFASDYAAAPDAIEKIYFTWAQGFLTAMNGASAVSNRSYRDLGRNVEGSMASIRAYCNAYPLAPYYEAVLDLYKTLPIVRGSQR